MALVLADTISEMCLRVDNVDRSVMAMRVGGRLRVKLRDEFKLNLDDLDADSREMFDAMMLEEWDRDEEEKARHKRADELLAQIEHLLGRKGVGLGMESPSSHGPLHKVIAAALDYKSKGETQAAAVITALRAGGHVKEAALTHDFEADVAKEIDAYTVRMSQHVIGRSLISILHSKFKDAGIIEPAPEPPPPSVA